MYWIAFAKIAFNFLIFAIIQTVFFHTIISQFVDKVIEDKMSKVGDIIRGNLNAKQRAILEQRLQRSLNESRSRTMIIEESRAKKNLRLLVKTIGPLVAGGAFVFVWTLCSALGKKQVNWEVDLWIGLVLIFSYMTEIALYFILFNRYEFIGTAEILKIINDELAPPFLAKTAQKRGAVVLPRLRQKIPINSSIQ